MKPGVNYCHCMMCHTEFYFGKEDIIHPMNNARSSSRFPIVICPTCGHDMKLGWNDRHFTYKEPKSK